VSSAYAAGARGVHPGPIHHPGLSKRRGGRRRPLPAVLALRQQPVRRAMGNYYQARHFNRQGAWVTRLTGDP